MTRALINAPKSARRGEIIEIKAMIAHKMGTGYRIGPNGQPIPRVIIHRFACTYGGIEVFAAELFPAMSANPFIAFTTVAMESGTIEFAWTADDGTVERAAVELAVT